MDPALSPTGLIGVLHERLDLRAVVAVSGDAGWDGASSCAGGMTGECARECLGTVAVRVADHGQVWLGWGSRSSSGDSAL